MSALIRKGSNRLFVFFFPCSSVHFYNSYVGGVNVIIIVVSPCSSLLSISVACDKVLVIDIEGNKIVFLFGDK